jgi:serine/threonine protein kinase
MSPEQIKGEKVDKRTDIWSLGVLLYEMITGKPPFHADYEQTIVYLILNEGPEDVSNYRKDVPERLLNILEKSITKNKNDRYEDLRLMIDDLRNVMNEKVLVSYQFEIPAPKPSQSIAVLPFINMSADSEQEYFCDGLTEELINMLSKIRDRECKYPYFWIPNTKPSDNCGIEIKEINDDSCIVDLYENYPQYASPSKPRNLNIELDSLVKFVCEENTEPDLMYYKIYKKSNNLKFELYDSTKYPSFVDYEEKPSLTTDSNNYVLYKITSVDSENKESTFSKEIKIAVENEFDTNVDLNKKSTNNFLLYQNYPNPFNPSTTIKYSIPTTSYVTLKVYDILGREVTTLINEAKPTGTYEVKWNAVNLPSGVYFYQLTAGNYTATKKLLLLK